MTNPESLTEGLQRFANDITVAVSSHGDVMQNRTAMSCKHDGSHGPSVNLPQRARDVAMVIAAMSLAR